ncbi:MAG: hypothetical protein HY683_07160 [Chloroflexi bacterium]|nr:hypothetical protein [Chloroflexota bacterium]
MVSLLEREDEVKQEIANKHKEELHLLQKLLDVYIQGFSSIGSFTRTADNDAEYAQLLLTARSFNSLRSAHSLLQQGYYEPALVLTRSVHEDWLVAKDCEANKATLEGLLENPDTFWKGALAFANMAKRHGFRDAWQRNYGDLSTIAHPRRRALTILVDPATKTLRVGAAYDEVLFIGTYDAIVQAAVVMSVFLDRLLWHMPPLGTKPWHTLHRPVILEACKRRQELKVQLGMASP